MRRLTLTLLAALALLGLVAAPAVARGDRTDRDVEGHRDRETIEFADARLKFEINATDGDGGVHVFIDGDQWRWVKIFDPRGRTILSTRTSGIMARQGGTELFLESAEPSFDELSLDELLERFPEGSYRFLGRDLDGNRLVGEAVLTHDLPSGPELVSPVEGGPLQDPDHTTLEWRPVDPPAGSSIIGYQVLVVHPDTGLAALPKIALDVIMPPTATSLTVPAGFLDAGVEYEWEVLAIEASGNQTLSSSIFTTTG